MVVTATQMANEGKKILDQVIQTGETVEIQQHGRTIASLHPHVGATRSELVRLLQGRGFSAKDSQQLRDAMDEASDIVGYAGGN